MKKLIITVLMFLGMFQVVLSDQQNEHPFFIETRKSIEDYLSDDDKKALKYYLVGNHDILIRENWASGKGAEVHRNLHSWLIIKNNLRQASKLSKFFRSHGIQTPQVMADYIIDDWFSPFHEKKSLEAYAQSDELLREFQKQIKKSPPIWIEVKQK